MSGDRLPSIQDALAVQVLSALGLLLDGFAAVDAPPRYIYDGLVGAVLRLVFLLYAEAQDRSGPLRALYDELGEEPGVGESRHGAWRRLLGLLEGTRCDPGAPGGDALLEASLPDDLVARVLGKLLFVGGERVPYAALDVEQIGFLYEAMMSFELHRAPSGATKGIGRWCLRAGDQRRRSGAHYTPRALTRPVLESALGPVLDALGPRPHPDAILALRVCDPAMGSGAFLIEACRQLAEALVAAWSAQPDGPETPPAAGRDARARRLVAERCLYGVDTDRLAVNLARLSLWLVARAEGPPSTFLGDRLRHGDALVGLTRQHITEIGRSVGDLGPDRARAIGDRYVAAFFAGTSDRPILPFHWEIEFPEVFQRENGGFDALVGNPPFLGGKRISTVYGAPLKRWLAQLHVGTSSNVDLVAHFFRRAGGLLRRRGALGMLATNTIAQGDTRRGGLAWMLRNGFRIASATRRVPWPGAAAVVVSAVTLVRGEVSGLCRLDGREVRRISAFLVSGPIDDDPAPLTENAGCSFIGCDIKGQGFLFDDGDAKASPTALRDALLARSPAHGERIRPYLGGEDINDTPDHRPRRWVIDFGQLTEVESRSWPDLFEIVERKVRPERSRRPGGVARSPWWQFWRSRPALRAATAGEDAVLAASIVTTHLAFARLPSTNLYSHKVAVITRASFASFAVLQARVHEVFARFFSSTLGDALNYSPSDCFETFPFPPAWRESPALESIGSAYHGFRAALMIAHGQGLTATYNRLHDRDEHDPGIVRLRALHDALDRAVLDAYGWTDLQPTCQFLPDREKDPGRAGRPRRRVAWRYRWPDAIRDEVLDRLLALNHQQAKAQRSGPPRRTA
jgi:hypothetical protein